MGPNNNNKIISKLNKTKQKRVNKRSSSIMNIFFLSLFKKKIKLKFAFYFLFQKKFNQKQKIEHKKIEKTKQKRQKKKKRKKKQIETRSKCKRGIMKSSGAQICCSV